MWEHYPQVLGRGIFKVDPYVQKLHILLLSKSLVSKIDQKEDPWSMEKDERRKTRTILMS